MRPVPSSTPLDARLSFWMLAALLAVLWIAGGASRADASGQVIVRLAAWIILVIYILVTPKFEWRAIRMPAVLLGAGVIIVALQLVPLPPAVWTQLPGRDVLIQAAVVAGETEQPWRPLSISPGATDNALNSLVVPTVTLVLLANLTRRQHWQVAALLIALMFASAVYGLLQFSGARIDHPLLNDVRGMVSGSFANRNHLALFLAAGCALAPAWALKDEGIHWKTLAGIGLLVFFALMILGTGSRGGMLVGATAIAVTLLSVGGRVYRLLARLPRKYAIGLGVSTAASFIGIITLSIVLDRARSIKRFENLSAQDDLRSQIAPVVADIIPRYSPAGSGFGAFDPVFRISEPDHLLMFKYVNHAHNDWLEIVLDGGLAGAMLIAASLAWIVWRSLIAWKRPDGRDTLLARTGSILLLLFGMASFVDYPARTPMIMSLVVIAAVWLSFEPQKATS
ncbi:O-antigen ligase [Croceicoccus sp. Ery15]|uniref:O-antigen ligase family protein n=1 Tax=Croceicoccus sp. Ery15 TaxID=1703338 RepID=UPI001E31DA5A|nr:O-antigen ligase family protein [Croceicoccus sp. Ery15]